MKPSLFNRLKAQAGKILKYERGANYELGNSLSSTAVSAMFGTGNDINVIEEYNGFAWKCINIRAEMLADQELFVERGAGDKWVRDLNHEFNDVLEGDEGTDDLSELLEGHEKSMCLYGESFWYFSKGERTNKPFGVYLLPPASMTVLVSGNRVTGYIFQEDGQYVQLDLDEIAHFKIKSPHSKFRGYGPMQAAGWFVKSSRYWVTYINNFLENNAIPAGVVVVDETVDDDDWALFKNQWSNQYAGIDNAGKTGFLRGRSVDFKKTGMSLGEVDFEKIKNTNREDVMVMFGISKPMMAIFDDINRASAVTARQLFAMTVTSPALKKVTRKLTKKVSVWYGPQFRVNSSDPVPEDEEVKYNRLEKGVGRWITVNEARAVDGLPPVTGGDEIPTSVAPPVSAPKSLGKVRIKRIAQKASFNYEMKESFRGKTENIQIRAENELLDKAAPVFREQKKEVLAQLKPKKALTDTSLNVEKEAAKLTIEILPVFIELAKKQGQLSVEFVTNEDAKFDLEPVMEKYIQDSVEKAAVQFTKDTRDKIANALAEGLKEGESIADISKRISVVYDDVIDGYRSERLARTEVIRTSNEITEAAYKQTGVVHKKEWFANPGHCEFCASLNGSVINLGATFVPKGSQIEGDDGGSMINDYDNINHPPTHPNCRCTLIPVIES